MPDRPEPPYEKPIKERRTPLGNDVDPDGMDSETEGDELEAGPFEDESADSDVGNGPDGVGDRRTPGQRRTSGTHGSTGEGAQSRNPGR